MIWKKEMQLHQEVWAEAVSNYSLENSEQQPAKADNPAVAAMPLETKIKLLLGLRHQLVLPNLL